MGKMKKKISKWKPKLSREELERRRLAAGEDLKSGMKESDVARKYDVNPSSVTRWKQMIEEEGMDGLKRRKAPGAKSKLSEDQQETLKRIILQGAAAYGYKTDLWTLRRVAEFRHG
jgi:transposase